MSEKLSVLSLSTFSSNCNSLCFITLLSLVHNILNIIFIRLFQWFEWSVRKRSRPLSQHDILLFKITHIFDGLYFLAGPKNANQIVLVSIVNQLWIPVLPRILLLFATHLLLFRFSQVLHERRHVLELRHFKGGSLR